jgi:hypothetical protein
MSVWMGLVSVDCEGPSQPLTKMAVPTKRTNPMTARLKLNADLMMRLRRREFPRSQIRHPWTHRDHQAKEKRTNRGGIRRFAAEQNLSEYHSAQNLIFVAEQKDERRSDDPLV